MKKILAVLMLFLLTVSANAETISFATYYPVPYAEYPQITVVENSSLVEKGGTFTSKDFNVGVRTDAEKNLTATTLDGTKTGTNAIATIADPAKTKIRGDLEVTTFDVTQTALTGNGTNKGVAKAYLQNLYIYGKLFPDPAKVSGATAMEWSNIKFYVDGGTYQRDFLELLTSGAPSSVCNAVSGTFLTATKNDVDTCDGDAVNWYYNTDKACTDVRRITVSTGSLKSAQFLNENNSMSDQEMYYQHVCIALSRNLKGNDIDLMTDALNVQYKKLYKMINGVSYDDAPPAYQTVWGYMKSNNHKAACTAAKQSGIISDYNSCLILQHKQSTVGTATVYYADVLGCYESADYQYEKREFTCTNCSLTAADCTGGRKLNTTTCACECTSPRTSWNGSACVCPPPQTRWTGYSCECPADAPVANCSSTGGIWRAASCTCECPSGKALAADGTCKDSGSIPVYCGGGTIINGQCCYAGYAYKDLDIRDTNGCCVSAHYDDYNLSSCLRNTTYYCGDQAKANRCMNLGNSVWVEKNCACACCADGKRPYWKSGALYCADGSTASASYCASH
ncbi:hypothetical protein Dip518_000369 [Parelusimicrobium proximum]|uniref:hypothetical protein n=1 Tax=Parelusimicrobium proximum TaxID=3228953 RepID=UPI003D181271